MKVFSLPFLKETNHARRKTIYSFSMKVFRFLFFKKEEYPISHMKKAGTQGLNTLCVCFFYSFSLPFLEESNYARCKTIYSFTMKVFRFLFSKRKESSL